VHQVGYYRESHQDARSTKHKMLNWNIHMILERTTQESHHIERLDIEGMMILR
jgi:hypothetical protein